MKKFLSALLLICILLTSCTYTEPADLTREKNAPVDSSYENQDYSLQPYISGQKMVLYQNKIFFNAGYYCLTYVTLEDAISSVDLSKDAWDGLNPKYRYTCPYDDEHKHGQATLDLDCPVKFGQYTTWLLDAYESNGSYPIFYYTFTRLSYLEQPASESGRPFVLYRYDTSTNAREELTELPGEAKQTMAYGDKIYMSIALPTGKYVLMLYDKNTKKITELEVGNGEPRFIHADEGGIYYIDRKDATLYRADLDLGAVEKLYTLDEVYELSGGASSEMSYGMFIHNGMLYYRADFETTPMQIHINGVKDEDNPNPQYINPVHYNIRRLPLDALSGEGELVAEGVFERCEFGVADNFLYFTPCDYGAHGPDGGYYNFSNGRLCKVDLDSLECTDVVTDSGLFFDDGSTGYTNGKFIIGIIRGLDEPWITNWNYNDAAGYYVLYDFETGSMYSLFNS